MRCHIHMRVEPGAQIFRRAYGNYINIANLNTANRHNQDYFNLYEMSFIEINQVYYVAMIVPITDYSFAFFLKFRTHT